MTSASPKITAARPPAVVELRRYALRPNRRDGLIELFESELVETQEEAGMAVIGQFTDRDDPDRFVWLRGFPDMRRRRRALAAFYDGPVWAVHRDAANATMLDSDDVLLLRPARDDAGFDLARADAAAGEPGAVAGAIAYLERAGEEGPAVDAFETSVAPAIAAAGGTVLGYFVTETSPNDFPRLPVREGERVLAWFAGFAGESALDAAAGPTTDAVRTAFANVGVRRVEHLRLAPTSRSLLTGRSAPCRALVHERPGRHDFDFLVGRWRVRNRKLRDPSPGARPEWVEFESEEESRPILGGLGNVDTYYAPDFPDRGPFHGLALRLFEPGTGLWRIWWASSAGGGRLDPPLAGRFSGGEGHFEGDDHVAGHPVKVRFRWSDVTEASARWEQSFSFDEGRTFAVNWVMELTRRGAPHDERADAGA